MNAEAGRSHRLLPGAGLLLAALLTGAPASAAFVTIHDVQFTALPGGNSPYQGQIVTTSGVVTAVYPTGFVLGEPVGGPWSGLWVYEPDHRPEEGDSLLVTGTVDEYFGLTELSAITDFQILARGAALPLPEPVTAATVATASSNAESYEGVLVTCPAVDVTQAAGSDGSWRIGDATGEAWVGDTADYLYTPLLAGHLAHVTGVLLYSWSEFRIQPRDEEDIGRTDVATFALRGTVVTPDQVLGDAYVVVNGRRIESVTTTAPPVPIHDTGGVIFPALIDAHNHPAYNVFGELDFGQLFDNRYQWQSDPDYLALKSIYDGLVAQGLYPEMWKYSEARAITWGAGTMQGAFSGADWDTWAHAKFLVRNPERFPGKIYSSIFPMNLSAATRQKVLNQIAGGVYRSVVIHLSEGTDAASLAEFYQWQSWGMLDSTTVIIHGVPYGPAEFAAMAAAGASLVWSPRSNLALYGATANIPAAVAAGVPVSLGVDWCVSGSRGILQELSVADSLNQAAFGGLLSDEGLVNMVTVNPARALGRGSDLGRIAPGCLADFTVVSPQGPSAYRALIDAAPQHVRLVMVEGRALYGIASLMDEFPAQGLEPFRVCDVVDREIRFRLDDAAVPSSADSLATVEVQLRAAYGALLSLNPCIVTGVGSGPVRTSRLILRAGPVPSSGDVRVWVSAGPGPSPGAAAEAGRVSTRVAIYDVAGREVRTLFEGRLAAEERQFTWDGRDRWGGRVSSGVYFIRARVGRDVAAQSIVLLR